LHGTRRAVLRGRSDDGDWLRASLPANPGGPAARFDPTVYHVVQSNCPHEPIAWESAGHVPVSNEFVDEGRKFMRIDAISIGKNPPEDINVIIEVAIGGEPIKYEMDKEAGTLVVDRFLYTPMRYPGNYGFVPHTLSEDGDPIDVLVANTRPIVPGAVISVRPVGVLKMADESGKDEKIIAVPSSKLTQRYVKVENYTDLPAITLDQIQHFFEHYKDLEPNKWVKVEAWGDAAEAKALILRAIERFKANH
jgi:inorganic pyrophosphatase